MSRHILLLILLPALFMVGCADQNTKHKTAKSNSHAVGSIHHVRTTAYTHTEPGGAHSACGTRLCDSNGKVKSAAADWSRFPIGTKFQIVGTKDTYEVCDYGSALVGKNTIDLYKSSRKAMHQWGTRYVDIKILEWGSPERSLKILAPRTRSKHVRVMVASLREQTS